MEVDGQDVYLVRGFLRALIHDVEETKGDDLVPPELNPERLGSPEGEDVEEPTPYCVLAHLLDQGDPFESTIIQICDQALKA